MAKKKAKAKPKAKAKAKPKTKAKPKAKAKAKKPVKKAAKKVAKKAKKAAKKPVKKAAAKKKPAPAKAKAPAAKKVAAKKKVGGGASLQLSPAGTINGIELEIAIAPVLDAVWYKAEDAGDGIEYRFPVGALAGMNYLSADLLLDGRRLGIFNVTLREGDNGPTFNLSFALLPQCSARMRMQLEAVNQNRWRYEREAAWLKPLCGGDRVDLARVDRMTISCGRKSEEPVRWCMTDVTASVDEPERLSELVLPAGQVIDELGQSATYDWPGKSRSALEVTARLEAQLSGAGWEKWPEGWSTYGGDSGKQFDATGYFRTHHDGARWWLVDPEGYAFWSAGCDCVRVDTNAAFEGLEEALAWLPDAEGGYEDAYGAGKAGTRSVNFLAANFIRAFGPEEWYKAWAAIALSQLKSLGFNTVANWSDWRIARDASFPYVRPLDLSAISALPKVYRDLPDVFAPEFESACAEYAAQLEETAGDRALIGYFLMNEPTWGFAKETPAAGMLFNAPACPARDALSQFLKERHGSDDGLSQAWGVVATLEDIASGAWTKPLSAAAQEDLADFSEVMCEKLFRTMSEACKAVDANHLNLGARYYTVPPAWAVKGMSHFDVFSMNCYRDSVPADELTRVAKLLRRPVMVGEWHFGAHDVGLPASGIGRVKDQAARGQAFRFYTEDAAAKPECVGVHYFTFYDQSAMGRFDGECYNIGFLDVCNKPYEELAAAARLAHERLYGVASGEVPVTEERPEYLEKLFL